MGNEPQIEWVAETKDRKYGRLIGAWDEQVRIFGEAGMSVILPEDAVDARLAGYDGFTRTKLIAVKVRGEPTILCKEDEIATPPGAGEIVRAHSRGEYPMRPIDFYEVRKEIAKSQEGLEPEERKAIIVTKNGDHSWAIEMPEAKFTLGPRIREYSEKTMKPSGVTEIPYFDLQANSKKHATFNYSGFGVPRSGSWLCCGSQSLHGREVSLEVLEKTAEGGSRAPSETILTNIRNANSQAVKEYLERNGMTGIAGMFEGLPAEVVKRYKELTK